ncbi:MAG: long-chain fatty acid--CoA ligase [Gammaproteobacteria bacterium]|nr:long-chain fatty acid--CoA ligase [Gammaproteobacteria bacterium]
MQGLMMTQALTIGSLMAHAQRLHPHQQIVSVTADHGVFRYAYRDCFARSARLANALARLGMDRGDRVATLAWNDHRHMELYYAVSCSGGICHTVNPRLFPEQIRWILDHAEARLLFIDAMFLPLVEKLAPALQHIEHIVVMSGAQAMPATALPNVLCYETLLEEADAHFDWPTLDADDAAALCYTSGTTGNPKGVLYSHRALLLHAYACTMPDVMNLARHDVVLPVVPMFHVNAWGVPYAAILVGAKLVLPGPKMGDGETLAGLMDDEGVTLALGVPTVWQGLLEYLRKSSRKLRTLRRTIVGGSACPLSMMQAFEREQNVWVHHAWGMTELSPLGTFNAPPPGYDALPEDEQARLRASQGRPVFGIELKIVDDDNTQLPWDGKAFGALKVRGPWVCSGYYRETDNTASHDADGWFDTGDVASIDADGYMTITDRTKDVIKSGGEWISSIALENIALSHPGVRAAAVIGVQHKKWDERPLLLIVPGEPAPTRDAMLAHFEGRVAKWWIPDDVVFVDELPLTATGKISKLTLRQRYADHALPGDG